MHTVDWLPTLASLIGVEPSGEKPLDGVDQLETLRFPNVPAKKARNAVFLCYSMNPGLVRRYCNEESQSRKLNEAVRCTSQSYSAYRQNHWKLVRHPDRVTYELFHMIKDKGEENNLRDQYPGIVNRLNRLSRIMVRAERDLPAVQPEDEECPEFRLHSTTWGQDALKPWC